MHILHQYFIIDNFNIYHRGHIFDFCYILKRLSTGRLQIYYIFGILFLQDYRTTREGHARDTRGRADSGGLCQWPSDIS